MMKPSHLMAELRRGRLAPLYLFSGEEGYLIRQALDLLVAKAVEPETRDFNYTTVYCRETPASELVALAETLPVLASRRLIIAKEFDAYKAADVDMLLPYLRNPAPQTCLVLVSSERKYDRKPVISAIEDSGGICVVFYSPFESEVQGWLTEWARSRGLTLRPEAAHYVQQTLGTDLQAIANELEKAAIYLGDRTVITLEDVRKVVADFREYSALDLVDAVGSKDRERAFVILGRILQEGDQPVGILGMLTWNFRRLLRAKRLEEDSRTYDEIRTKLKISYVQSGSFREQMRRFTSAEVRRAFRLLLATDLALKSGRLRGGLTLERLILKLCGP